MRNKLELEKRWRPVFDGYKEYTSESQAEYWEDREKFSENDLLHSTSSWHSHLSALGRFEYLLNGNVELFKKYLKESVLVYQELFEAYEQGKPVNPGFLTMLRFQTLFEALATGDMELAKNFSKHLGGVDDKIYGIPFFAIEFGYTLKYFVEQAEVDLKKAWLKKFLARCLSKKVYMPFLGYAQVFEAMLEKDSDKANEGFKELIKGHEIECKCKGESYFRGRSDEDICIWGIGLANLAIYQGLNIKIEHPLIPNELLLKMNQAVC